jgi:hypothetical protein
VGGFVVMALIILPAAWYAGRVDAMPAPPSPVGEKDNAPDMARFALKHPPFAVMTLAYFVCGMQLVFLTTHLPSYLDLCGMDPMLSAQALGMIGGFNVLGSLFFGWAGGRYNKLLLLGGIYVWLGISCRCQRRRTRWCSPPSWDFCGWVWRLWSPATSAKPLACAGKPCWAASPS